MEWKSECSDEIFMDDDHNQTYRESTEYDANFTPFWLELDHWEQGLMLICSIYSSEFDAYIEGDKFTKDLKTITKYIDHPS